LLVSVLGAAIAWLSFAREVLSPWWLSLPLLAFLALVIFHSRVIRSRERMDRAAAFYERGLARVGDRWAGTGETGDRFVDASHPYAEDLDLFGRGSLFELLCTARTRAGEETLASWLLAPAEPGEVRHRHGAVEDLRPRLDLREDLAVLGIDVRAGVHPESLATWGSAPPMLDSPVMRTAACALGALAGVTLCMWAGFGLARVWFLAALTLEALFFFKVRPAVRRIEHAVEPAGRDLALLSGVLERLERELFTSPRLKGLSAKLGAAGHPASRQISRLRFLIDLLDAQRNPLFAPIAFVLLWSTQFAFAIEAWRKRSGPFVARWLSAVGEFEALSALAGYAYEHPKDPFPELKENELCFRGEALGHPLLPETGCVRNDVSLGDELRVMIVSGSNMSGKSTLLRTVGTNAVLAMAGAPVRARRLVLSPVVVGASIRIHDSLQSGSSRFYAEITRLRKLVDLTGKKLPLLFLVDELLHGTNSHDRRIGAEAIVKGLVDRGALGLVTTHDLALSHIADSLAPRAANVHFQDHIEDGKLVFDYRLHPGIVQKSNALELMRSIGLEV